MKEKRKLQEIDIDSYNFTDEALKYLGKEGKSKIVTLYKDLSTNNWVMAKIKDGYFVALSNGYGCKSTGFGSVEHTKSIFDIPNPNK